MYQDRPIFWPVFWAMFAALVAFNLLKWGVLALLAAGLLVSFGESMKPATTPGHLPARYDAQAAQVYQREEPPPVWPGPLGAVRRGSSRACINGVEADRVSNGWRQRPNHPCVASSN